MGDRLDGAHRASLLDQEVRDASDELRQCKDSLVAIIARQKLAEEKCQQLREQVAKHEGYATQALEKGEEALALEVAQKIADLENQLHSEETAAGEYANSANQLREAVKQAEQNIKRLKQQVDTVKATENVQRAQAAVAERHSGSNSKLQTAMESLERIKEKQAQKSAQMKAATELAQETTEDNLQRKLEQAGIVSSGSSAQEILERLKQKKS